MDASIEPLQIGDDFVLARWRDEDDTPYVRRYRLETTGREGPSRRE
jgi:hypothetical protein